jgi:hypothetical protein
MKETTKTVLTVLGAAGLIYMAYKAATTPGGVKERATAAVMAPVEAVKSAVTAVTDAAASIAAPASPAAEKVVGATTNAIQQAADAITSLGKR